MRWPAAFLAAIMLWASPVVAQDVQPNAVDMLDFAQRKQARNADVFLLRGGFGAITSTGLNEIGQQLVRRGIDAKVMSHRSWRSALQTIVDNKPRRGRRPVILIGHSLGANRAIDISRSLAAERIRVDYMVTFAATDPLPIPRNVSKATNYYFATGGWGEPIVQDKGFRGTMKNIDFSNSSTIGHFNIDEQPRLQRQVVNNVLRILGMRRRADADVGASATAG